MKLRRYNNCSLCVCAHMLRFEEPLAHMLTVCRRTVREQLDALQQRREHQSRPHHNAPGPAMLLIPPPCTLMVTPNQKQQLQQQVQQVSTRELAISFKGDNMQTSKWILK